MYFCLKAFCGFFFHDIGSIANIFFKYIQPTNSPPVYFTSKLKLYSKYRRLRISVQYKIVLAQTKYKSFVFYFYTSVNMIGSCVNYFSFKIQFIDETKILIFNDLDYKYCAISMYTYIHNII